MNMIFKTKISLIIFTLFGLSNNVFAQAEHTAIPLQADGLRKTALNHPAVVQSIKAGQKVIWQLYFIDQEGEKVYSEVLNSSPNDQGALIVTSDAVGYRTFTKVDHDDTSKITARIETVQTYPLQIFPINPFEPVEVTVIRKAEIPKLPNPQLDKLYRYLHSLEITPLKISPKALEDIQKNSPRLINYLKEVYRLQKCPEMQEVFTTVKQFSEQLMEQKKHINFKPKVLGNAKNPSFFCGFDTAQKGYPNAGEIFVDQNQKIFLSTQTKQNYLFDLSPDAGIYMGDQTNNNSDDPNGVDGSGDSYRKKKRVDRTGKAFTRTGTSDLAFTNISNGVYIMSNTCEPAQENSDKNQKERITKGASFLFTPAFFATNGHGTVFWTKEEKDQAIYRIKMKIQSELGK